MEVSRNILYGSFFDDYLPLVPQQTLVLQSRIPSCATRRREGCRHIVQLDAPAEVAGLIARFCATGLTPAAW